MADDVHALLRAAIDEQMERLPIDDADHIVIMGATHREINTLVRRFRLPHNKVIALAWSDRYSWDRRLIGNALTKRTIFMGGNDVEAVLRRLFPYRFADFFQPRKES